MTNLKLIFSCTVAVLSLFITGCSSIKPLQYTVEQTTPQPGRQVQFPASATPISSSA